MNFCNLSVNYQHVVAYAELFVVSDEVVGFVFDSVVEIKFDADVNCSFCCLNNHSLHMSL